MTHTPDDQTSAYRREHIVWKHTVGALRVARKAHCWQMRAEPAGQFRVLHECACGIRCDSKIHIAIVSSRFARQREFDRADQKRAARRRPRSGWIAPAGKRSEKLLGIADDHRPRSQIE